MRVGVILLDKKRPRVLTPALSAAAERHGFKLLALDPDADPQQWAAQGVDVIVHKVPEDYGLDARLLALQAAQPQLVLLDAPAAVRALQHREAMLAPLAGQPLLLTQPASSAQVDNQQQQQLERCLISVPAQVTLLPGSTAQQAVAQLAAAGISLPALLKPLSSIPRDAAASSTAAAADNSGSAGNQASCTTAAAAAAAVDAAVADGHALGVVLEEAGLQQLLAGAVPQLAPPVVVQQFVPHGEGLYKLYVIGPHVVLTRRSTLTLQHTQEAAAAAAAAAGGAASTDAGRPAVVLLQRVSAVPLPAAQAGRDSSSHTSSSKQHCAAASGANGIEQPAAAAAAARSSNFQGSKPDRGAGTGDVQRCAAGTALADASVLGDAAAPPLWAMQQLAAHLRQQLQLNLFNVDIIAPEQQQQQQQQVDKDFGTRPAGSSSVEGSSSSSSSSSTRCFLVVDVNFFPGFDKVPGAEQLFADYLASLEKSRPV